MKQKVEKSDEEWRAQLTPDEYAVLRGKGTEMPFTGKLLNDKRKGTYVCAGCGNELFDSEAKFDSGSGWPSFYAPVSKDSVVERADRSLFMTRTEVVCSRCGSHLGHVFNDGPPPTGIRYCINSVALGFVERERARSKSF